VVITVTVGMVGSGLIRTLALGTPAVPGTANASIGLSSDPDRDRVETARP
jgi:hypothetical protein